MCKREEEIREVTLREQFTFETYINTPEKTPASELITGIYIPVIKNDPYKI